MTAAVHVAGCLDCRAPLAADRRLRRICASCEAVRAAASFWQSARAGEERHAAIVGPEYAALTLADFDAPLPSKGLELYRRHATREGVLYGVLLLGEVGPGKTAFAAALTRLWVFAGASVRWLPVRQLCRQIRDTYNGDGADTESDVIDAITATDLVVLDDLGREGSGRDGKPTEHVLALLHDIIDERIRWHRPTLITTNLNGTALAARYGAALASRFALLDRIVVNGADRRQAHA